MRNDLRPEIAAVPVARAFRVPLDRRNPVADEPRRTLDLVALAKDRGLPLEYV
jgi:hypothetical protein